ncbi:MAG: VWA domain-containing protein [Lachnospiraceae bacterium]|nr:VWA domain-containing protein [Lachnospiraceae bacterium]
MKDNGGKILVMAVVGIFALVLIFGGLFISRNFKKTDKAITKENAEETLAKYIKHIEPSEGEPVKGAVEYSGTDNTYQELPDLKEDSIAVRETTDSFAEIFASSEKTGEGKNGFLKEMAEEFNSANISIDGVPVSIRLRTVSSGQQVDYVASGKYVPDAMSPSSDLFVKMAEEKGAQISYISDSVVENYAGLVMKKKIRGDLKELYGSADVKAAAQAVSEGKMSVGYTNPFSSAAGLNFLVTLLDSYDAGNITSDKAVAAFRAFQKNIPFVAMTTGQMVDAAKNGSFDMFVSEYQSYKSDGNLSKNYVFVPYGFKHNNPLAYIKGGKGKNAQKILEEFSDFIKASGASLAKEDGFNEKPEGYKELSADYSGSELIDAQSLYKENKDSKPVACVFVTDVSGSMDGEPIQMLKNSLSNAIQYINKENHIGLISYSDDVTIELPLAQFDMNQQSYFKGTVDRLSAAGGTATFDGVCVAANMLVNYMKQNSDIKPMIFVLSDGETNEGYSLEDISPVMKGLKIPVYTICYNGDFDAMEKLAAINEGVSINADTDDVVYQLKQLFNANM